LFLTFFLEENHKKCDKWDSNMRDRGETKLP